MGSRGFLHGLLVQLANPGTRAVAPRAPVEVMLATRSPFPNVMRLTAPERASEGVTIDRSHAAGGHNRVDWSMLPPRPPKPPKPPPPPPRRSRNADGYEPTCEASIAGFANSWRRE